MFDMAYHILGITRNNEFQYVEVKTLKVKFQHLGKYEQSVFFKFNINNGRYVPIAEDSKESSANIQWDNKSWVEYDSQNFGMASIDAQQAILSFEASAPELHPGIIDPDTVPF